MRKLVLTLVSFVGCLPADTRPPPAEVLVNVESSASTREGLVTTDGWTIRFDRVLLSVGDSDVDGDDCDSYAGASYQRILDGRLNEPQKLGLVFGLGDCSLAFRARPPDGDSLLGKGITETDRDLLRIPATDPFTTTEAAVVFLVQGSAENGGVKKTFDWTYRARSIYEKCKLAGDQTFHLDQNGTRTLAIEVHAEALFLDGPDATKAVPRFAAFAAADDGDGKLTYDELTKVKIADAGLSLGDSPDPSWKTLGDWLYRGAFPRILRFGATGVCSIRTREPRGPGGGM